MGRASSISRDRSVIEIPRRWRRKAPDGMLHESLEPVELERGEIERRAAGRAATAPAPPGGRVEALAPARLTVSKLHGRLGDERPGREVAGVEGLQRVPDDDLLAGPCPPLCVTVASMTSSSSFEGTAGGRARLVRSSRAV